MQLVIEISDGLYNNLDEIKNGSIASKIILNCVKKGQILPKGHGRLIDADKLKEKLIEWMPKDPCGQEEREYPIEENIIISAIMSIEETKTVIEANKEG